MQVWTPVEVAAGMEETWKLMTLVLLPGVPSLGSGYLC